MCECIKRVNEKLAEHNTRIEVPWIGPQLPFVTTIKLDEKKRGKPVRMFATHCPFCGEKYGEEERRNPLGEGEVVQAGGDPA